MSTISGTFNPLPFVLLPFWLVGVGPRNFLTITVLISQVAQIEFTEWTPGGHLRHSRFIGLREDKEAREVVQEGRV